MSDANVVPMALVIAFLLCLLGMGFLLALAVRWMCKSPPCDRATNGRHEWEPWVFRSMPWARGPVNVRTCKQCGYTETDA